MWINYGKPMEKPWENDDHWEKLYGNHAQTYGKSCLKTNGKIGMNNHDGHHF
jgi:hypothetical protein